jgi:hypothetical protein
MLMHEPSMNNPDEATSELLPMPPMPIPVVTMAGQCASAKKWVTF